MPQFSCVEIKLGIESLRNKLMCLILGDWQWIFCYSTYDLNLVPIAFFAKKRVYMESPGNEVALIYDFALILLKPAIIFVSVNKKTARSWVWEC